MYEETAHIPLIFKAPNLKSRRIDDAVSSLDIFPTLCSYADIKVPANLSGQNLAEALKGEEMPDRKYVVSQWYSEWGVTITPARMIATKDYKYMYFLEDHFEELYDLKIDRLEQTNVAQYPEYKNILQQMRSYFQDYLKQTNDPFMTMPIKIPKGSRNHKLGQRNHIGFSEPMKLDQIKNPDKWIMPK